MPAPSKADLMPKKTKPSAQMPVGQCELPGCEPDAAGALKRKADAPLKPGKPQKACDHGLFGNAAGQADLFAKRPSSIIKPKPDTANGSRKKSNAGFILTPEEWEEKGHRLKGTDPARSARYYRLAQMIRVKIAIAAGRLH